MKDNTQCIIKKEHYIYQKKKKKRNTREFGGKTSPRPKNKKTFQA